MTDEIVRAANGGLAMAEFLAGPIEGVTMTQIPGVHVPSDHVSLRSVLTQEHNTICPQVPNSVNKLLYPLHAKELRWSAVLHHSYWKTENFDSDPVAQNCSVRLLARVYQGNLRADCNEAAYIPLQQLRVITLFPSNYGPAVEVLKPSLNVDGTLNYDDTAENIEDAKYLFPHAKLNSDEIAHKPEDFQLLRCGLLALRLYRAGVMATRFNPTNLDMLLGRTKIGDDLYHYAERDPRYGIAVGDIFRDVNGHEYRRNYGDYMSTDTEHLLYRVADGCRAVFDMNYRGDKIMWVDHLKDPLIGWQFCGSIPAQ